MEQLKRIIPKPGGQSLGDRWTNQEHRFDRNSLLMDCYAKAIRFAYNRPGSNLLPADFMRHRLTSFMQGHGLSDAQLDSERRSLKYWPGLHALHDAQKFHLSQDEQLLLEQLYDFTAHVDALGELSPSVKKQVVTHSESAVGYLIETPLTLPFKGEVIATDEVVRAYLSRFDRKLALGLPSGVLLLFLSHDEVCERSIVATRPTKRGRYEKIVISRRDQPELAIQNFI